MDSAFEFLIAYVQDSQQQNQKIQFEILIDIKQNTQNIILFFIVFRKYFPNK